MTDPHQIARFSTPTIKAQASHFLPQVERACQPCDRQWLLAQLTGLFATFPTPGNSPQANAARSLAYVDDLCEYPADVVAQAIRQARRAAEAFCPSPKNIRDYAEPLMRERVETRAGLKRLIAAKSEQAPPATREQVDAIMKHFRRPKPPAQAPTRRQHREQAFDELCRARGLDPHTLQPVTP